MFCAVAQTNSNVFSLHLLRGIKQIHINVNPHLCVSSPDLRCLFRDAPLTYIKFNPLNDELNPIRHLLTLLGAHHIFHVSRIRVNNRHKLQNSAASEQYVFQVIFINFVTSELEVKHGKPSTNATLRSLRFAENVIGVNKAVETCLLLTPIKKR